MREIRNLQGEVIRVIDDHESDEKRPVLSLNTAILFTGVALVLSAFFPNLLKTLFGIVVVLLDFRTWYWWYYPIFMVLIFFVFRWKRFYSFYRGDDVDIDPDEIKPFLRMSILLTFELVFLIVANLFDWLYFPTEYLKGWLGRGDFTWQALGYFAIVCPSITVPLYYIKEWGTVYFRSQS